MFNENYVVDVAIDWKTTGKKYSWSILFPFYCANLTFGYLWYSSTAYATNNSKKKSLFEGIRVELQASEPRTAITCAQFV